MDKYDVIVFDNYILERFWEKVILTHYDNGDINYDGCMIWNAGKFSDGYGAFSIKRKVYRSHRVAYVYYYGPVNQNHIVICHKCDNPLCVNPLHLFKGTVQDNHDDCKNKNRTLKGSLNGYSSLNEIEVFQIKNLLKLKKHTHKEISILFNVSRPTITDINSGKTWSHII